MFDTMRIRTKLAIALSIPLIALVILSGVAISSANRKADEARATDSETAEQIQLATTASGPTGVVNSLQNERTTEAVYIIGADKMMATAPRDETRKHTDDAIQAFKATIAAKPPAVQDAYKDAIAALDRVPSIRTTIDAYTGPRSLESTTYSGQRFMDYSQIISELFRVNSKAADSVDDPSLRAGATFINLISEYQDAQTLGLRDFANSSFVGGGLLADPSAFAGGVEHIGRANEILASARQQGPFYDGLVSDTQANPQVQRNNALTAKAMTGTNLTVSELLDGDTNKSTEAYTASIKAAADHLQVDAANIQAQSQQVASDAESQARNLAIATGFVLLLGIGVTLVASTSITKPLHRLTTDAEAMANTNLPQTVQDILDAPLGEDVALPELAEIDKSGGYEIAEVATALNTVQQSAAELAVEQAVLRRNIADSFVNLGRRNQNLLSRQLDSITEMERTETDPDELAKLFTLDHLATRMRRNAESLLLLAGLEPHRQWSAPVAIVDILRGALGEVEDYDRVSIRKLDAATIKGTAAADITHLIAELLENALHFSPPGRDVEIVGRQMGEGYTLAIMDNGIGMAADEMEQANVRLAGQESFTVAPSKYLGHYVVGRQAARLDTEVRLKATPAGGVTAVIALGSILSVDEATHLQDEPEFSAEALVPERFQRDNADGASAHVTEESAIADMTIEDESDDEVGEHLEPATALDLDFDLESDWEDADEPEAPATLAQALTAAPETPETAEEQTVQTTASGYKKRVRGSHTPNTTVRSVQHDNNGDAPSTNGAEGVRNALSGLQAGQDRAKKGRPAEGAEGSATEEG